MAELVNAANKRIAKEKIRPADPRAKATVTTRTIQFYLSKGLLPEPSRRGAQLRFDEHHVDAVVHIKRQQAKGFMLDEIVEGSHDYEPEQFVAAAPLASRTFISDLFNRTESRATMWNSKFDLLSTASPDFTAVPLPVFKWHIAIGHGMELSGQGEVPDRRTIESIRLALGGSLSESEEDDE